MFECYLVKMFGIVRKKGTVEGETAEEAEGQGPLWRALADTKEETEEIE